MNRLSELPEIARKWHTARTLQPGNESGTHDYMPVYQEFLAGREIRKIVEMGIGPRGLFHPEQVAGCGLFMWRDVFPDAEIIGLDNDPTTLVEDQHIRSYLCDQSSMSDLLRAAAWIGGGIDLFVDDASHVPADQIRTAQIFVPLLSENGVYVIEDVIPGNACADGIGYNHVLRELRTDVLTDDRLIIIEARKKYARHA